MMKTLFVITSLTALAAAAPALAPADGQLSAGAYVAEVTYGGQGCPQGSLASTSPTNDLSKKFIVELHSDTFVAKTGKDVPITEVYKNCQINLDVRIPAGVQYAVTSSKWAGTVSVTSGVTAYQKASYYFAGTQKDINTQNTFVGPVKKDYEVQNDVPVLWSACGAPAALNIANQVRIDNKDGSASGLISGSVGKSITFELGFQWRAC